MLHPKVYQDSWTTDAFGLSTWTQFSLAHLGNNEMMVCGQTRSGNHISNVEYFCCILFHPRTHPNPWTIVTRFGGTLENGLINCGLTGSGNRNSNIAYFCWGLLHSRAHQGPWSSDTFGWSTCTFDLWGSTGFLYIDLLFYFFWSSNSTQSENRPSSVQ